MKSIYSCLGRAVSCGYLSKTHAMAALVATAARATRLGTDTRDLSDVIRCDEHLLDLYVDAAEALADKASADIQRSARRLAARCMPSNTIRGEAHNINADHGFPLTETVVDAIAAETVRIVIESRVSIWSRYDSTDAVRRRPAA